MKRKLLFGILLSLILLLVIVWQLDWQQLLLTLREVQLPPLVVAALLLTSTQFIKAWRWQFLLLPMKKTQAMRLVPATAIGAMTDMIFPARAGEVVRSILVGEKEQISKMSALATIVVEKIFDIITLIFVAIIMLFFLGRSAETGEAPAEFAAGIYVAVPILIVACLGLWLLRSHTEKLVYWTRRLLAFVPARLLDKGIGFLESFANGLQGVHFDSNLIRILGSTFFLWSVYALSNYFILTAFQLNLPLYASFLFLVFQILGVTLPSSPGFVGTYHAAVMVGFTIFNIAPELAFGVALIMHAAFFFPFILLGGFYVWSEGVSWQRLQTVQQGA